MSLQFAILTALTERESTGIELTRRFDRAFGYFWSATHQQIYRELDRLHTNGLVAETTPQQSTGRGQPKRFAITPDGRDALRAWIAQVDKPSPPRDALIVRVRAAAATGEYESVRDAVAHHLGLHLEAIETYQEIERRDFSAVTTDADRLRRLLLEAGLETERAQANWCREVLDTIDAIGRRDA
ncbi:PadR family transcriptional regulator [Nocardia macrotermitis]|uniref:PadR family transcriptional regulator n=1 Tax=Nocardia macrotermitis TaxID=2585198 RepID=UPI0029E802CF|nr:PadR family transcriptional regulator [Nocardia macrotermitis]